MQALEAALQTAVEFPIPQAQHQPADELGLDLFEQPRVEPCASLDGRPDPAAQRVVERHRARDADVEDLALALVDRPVGLGDLGQEIGATAPIDDLVEVDQDVGEAAAQRVLDRLGALRRRDERAEQRLADRRVLGAHGDQRLDLLEHRIGDARRLGDLEERFGVGRREAREPFVGGHAQFDSRSISSSASRSRRS